MTPAKAADSSRSTAPSASTPRKAWRKKSPTEVVLDQINKVRDHVALKESELKEARRQLERLEQARKVLEST